MSPSHPTEPLAGDSFESSAQSDPVLRGQPGPWDARLWGDLARRIELEPKRRLLLALSGGADSVFLLQVLAQARPRPDVLVVHINHGLRGAESRGDAEFCRALCRELGLTFHLEPVEIESGQGSLEARAREARYGVLGRIAITEGRCVLTAHHADDALETLLWRWTRGSEGPGLCSMTGSPTPLPGAAASSCVSFSRSIATAQVARPLRHLRRAEIRAWLSARRMLWREDSSNISPHHTRNRIRQGFLPLLTEFGGPQALSNLEAFHRATEALEERLAAGTADFAWEPLRGTEPASAKLVSQPAPGSFLESGPRALDLQEGGSLERARLAALPRPLQRRVLWRLLVEALGRSPKRRLLERVIDDLQAGRVSRHTLPGGISLHLRSDVLLLNAEDPRGTPSGADRGPALELLFGRPQRLGDGRTLHLESGVTGALQNSPNVIEMAAQGMPDKLVLRQAVLGDRFFALGAPGSKRLVRFLADRGVPRALRLRTWVVVDPASNKLLAVLGHGPCEDLRVADTSRKRHRLWVEGTHEQPSLQGFWPSDPRADSVEARRRLPGRRGRDTDPDPRPEKAPGIGVRGARGADAGSDQLRR